MSDLAGLRQQFVLGVTERELIQEPEAGAGRQH